jgi:hypothetical protein
MKKVKKVINKAATISFFVVPFVGAIFFIINTI